MSENWLTQWQIPHNVLDCNKCDATFLHPLEQTEMSCPLCGHEKFSEVEVNEDVVVIHEPELVVPFREPEDKFNQALLNFRQSLIIPPVDCTVANLQARAHRFYWPMWLVDADVKAQWQAETGFNYDAVTYGEEYVSGEWRSRQKQEQRVRWEPRVGELVRRYDNQTAPALDEHQDIVRLLGSYDLKQQRPYQAQAVEHSLIRLPTRSPKDAWTDAQGQFQESAAIECQQAAGAQHVRQFKWSPQFGNHQWTQLLLPMMATYYLDDDGEKQMIYLHGQTGKTVGTRKASMKLARQVSFWLGGLAVLLLAVTAVFLLIPFFTQEPFYPELTGWLMFFTFCAILTPFAPPLLVFYFNTFQFLAEGQQLESSLVRSSQAYWQEPTDEE